MRRVIAFLGISPQQARYRYGDAIYEGRSFPEALRRFLPFDRMHVFVTEQARARTWPDLAALADARIEAVAIPEGRDSAEMWEIFDKLVGVVEDGDTLIFDITHAFRSIPFFVLLALAFLKSAYENVHIERVLYGGLLFGDPAPVIDLTEFIALLDWMSATDQFVRSGNSRALVAQLRFATTTPPSSAGNADLAALASALDDVSQALQLLIPDRAMTASHRLHQRLSAEPSPLENVQPVGRLLERIDAAFAPLALANPRQPANLRRTLELERDMVFWYLERQLFLQAIALSFEWLISYGLAHLEYDDLYNGDSRTVIRTYYTTLNLHRKNDPRVRPDWLNAARVGLRDLPERERVLDLYERVSRIRNDLMHTSKTVRALRTPADREREIGDACRELAALPLPS